MRYPEDFGHEEIMCHETGRVICPMCGEVCDEALMEADQYGEEVCPVCIDEEEEDERRNESLIIEPLNSKS